MGIYLKKYDLLTLKENINSGFFNSCNNDSILNVIVLNSMFNPKKYGIAPERLVKSYPDYEGTEFILFKTEDNRLKALVFLPEEDLEIKYAFQVISIFNQLSNNNFSFFVNKELDIFFNQYCNSHITVIPLEESVSRTITTNLVITYSTRVIHFLRNKIPVFVLGPYGLGGLVTPANLPFLFKTDFMGRPGGSHNEYVPIEIVAHELGLFKDMKGMDALLDENKNIADAFPVNPLSKEIVIQTESQKKLEEVYSDSKKKNSLKVNLCSNMNIIYNGQNAIIQRRYLNDTLCVLDKEDTTFFKALDGKNTCRDLQKEFN